jgi:1-aminocyclopropane-1-carboxylate deaminase/D-cysteine desulfhydrase-like pyridoxal-dependent ACC family enzyme
LLGGRRKSNRAREAIRIAARTEGLLLDPVYSGKAVAGLMSLARTSIDARAVVFLSTGGTPALLTSRYERWLTDEVKAPRPVDR